jgi:outer membrane protein assembly factor BamB
MKNVTPGFLIVALVKAAMVAHLISAPVRAEDWPQWRGPERNGISKETGLLKQWPKEGPKLLWKIAEAGSGYSTPSVVGDRIYILGNEGMDNEFVQALAVKDGKRIWSTRLGKVGPNQGPQYPGTRSTATVDGDALYALGSDGDLACVETATGKIRWAKNLRADFRGIPGKWAYAESPLVDGDAVICTPGGSEATLVALNKKTGETLWKCAVPGADPAAYASAIVVEAGGLKQYVQFVEKGIVGVEAKTGKLLWRYDKTAANSPANIPTPVAAGEYIYSASGRGGGALIRLKANQGAVEVEQIYAAAKLPTAIGGALLLGDVLYGTSSALLCVDFKSGNLKWEESSVGASSLCYADGHLYLHAENNGEVVLVEANPNSYREKGRFTPPGQPNRERTKAWAYPAVANGRLYIRDLGTLWCYDVKAASSAGR